MRTPKPALESKATAKREFCPWKKWRILGGLFVVTLFVGWLGTLLYGLRNPSVRLLRDLEVGNSSEKAAAEVALRRSGTNSLPQLLQLMSSKESPFHDNLARLLVSLHMEDFCILSSVEERRLALLGFEVLGEDARPAIPALLNLVTNPPTASDAALCLAFIGEPAIPALEMVLTNANPIVRSRAATAIGAVDPKSQSSVFALLRCLEDDSPTVRSCAAWALGRIETNSDMVVPALIGLLRDPETNVRRQAIVSLGAFGGGAEAAIDLLIPITQESNKVLRLSAESALREIRGER